MLSHARRSAAQLTLQRVSGPVHLTVSFVSVHSICAVLCQAIKLDDFDVRFMPRADDVNDLATRVKKLKERYARLLVCV